MSLLLKNHPFAVEAFFKSSVVLTFAFPKEKLQALLPPCLQLDTHHDKWGFVAAALVETKDLRPKGFPKILGKDFFLIGYRVFVRFTNNAGKKLRGLYILKSETNKMTMEFFGNIFTHYNYTTTDIRQAKTQNITEISSRLSDFKIKIQMPVDTELPLPDGSPFISWKEARRFAGPLPFTFTYLAGKKNVLVIEGVREDWDPKPLKVLDYHFSFLNTLNAGEAQLANAFIIQNIPYYWKKGKIEKWTSEENSRAFSIL